jgi:GT2 family glycosyltransferase
VTGSISVVIVAYRSGPALSRCLDSLAGQADAVIVVNNGGAAPEIEHARALDFVRVVESGRNLGFGGGCNIGAAEANGDVLVFLNPDTVVAPGAIEALATVLQESSVGAAMARVRLLDEPDLLNTDGNIVHLTGLAWAGGYREPADRLTTVRETAFPSGAAMAIRAELFREVGGFTEELFMYLEDTELGWRVRLRGLRIVVTPAAEVYHDYDFARNVGKRALIERNRLVFVLSAYSLRLLLLLAPVLVTAEVGLVGLAARQGWFRGKVAGWSWCARNARWLLEHRRATQALRQVSDRDIAGFLTPVIDPAMLPVPRLVRLANPLVSAYWDVVRRAL